MDNYNNHNINDEESKEKNDNDERLILFKELCPFIRFGLMNRKYFVEKVNPMSKFGTNSKNCRICVEVSRGWSVKL